MTTIRGWSRRGSKLIAKAPFGGWKTLTFLAALRHDRIDAPCVLDDPINGQLFTVYVEQFLVPTLKSGDIVIMDNLGSHKGQAVRKAIPGDGRSAPLPAPLQPRPQSDRTGLRQAQAALAKSRRALGRSDMEKNRTLLDAFPPQECANYLKNSRYAST